MRLLSSRVRLFLVGGALVTLVFSLWGALLRPLLITVDKTVEQLHDTRFELGRARAVVNQRNKVSEEMVLSEEREVFQHLLAGDSPNNAIGQLQGIVDTISRDSGLQLESMSAEPVSINEPLTKLSVVLKARGMEMALLKLLAALEGHSTLMVIDRLTVIAQDPAPSTGKMSAVGLAVEMRITGYWARSQPSKGAATS